MHICIPDSEIQEAKSYQIEKNLSCTFFKEKKTTIYDINLKNRLKNIIKEINPDVIHAFGTEYPRTYSMEEAA